MSEPKRIFTCEGCQNTYALSETAMLTMAQGGDLKYHCNCGHRTDLIKIKKKKMCQSCEMFPASANYSPCCSRSCWLNEFN